MKEDGQSGECSAVMYSSIRGLEL